MHVVRARTPVPKTAWRSYPVNNSYPRLPHELQGPILHFRTLPSATASSRGVGEPGTGAKVAKDRTGPDLDERPSISLFTEPGDSCGQINPFSPTRRHPTIDYSLVAGDAQRHQLQACLPYGHHAQYQSFYVRKLRKPCQNLGRAGDRYGVPGIQFRTLSSARAPAHQPS